MLHRLRLPFLALLTALALVLAACGDDDSTDVGDLGPDPATVAPADAPVYAEAVVRPEGDMLDDFNAGMGKLLGTDDAGEKIREALDEQLADDELSYSEDIEPWLGTRAGGFITDFDPEAEQAEGAVAIAVTDPDAAQEFVKKAGEADPENEETEATYNGVDYLTDEEGTAVGIDGDFLIVGTEQGFKDAVDAGDGDSLADSDTASTAREDIPDNSLFSGFVDVQAAVDIVKRSGGLSAEELKTVDDQLAQFGDGPVSFWGTVEENTMTLAGQGPTPEDASEPSDLVASFPADAWLAFASANFGEQIQNAVTQFESGFQASADDSFGSGVPKRFQIDPSEEFRQATGLDPAKDFAWIGDVGGFIEGTSIFGLGGGLVIEATDEDAASRALDKVQAALANQRSVEVTASDTGFRVQAQGAPIGAEVGLDDGKVVAAGGAASVEDVLSPEETLADSDRFNAAREALGDDATASLFLDFAPVVSLIESSGEASTDPDYQQAKPYLDALDYFVAGSQIEGDTTTGSLVLGVKEPTATTEDTAAATIVP